MPIFNEPGAFILSGFVHVDLASAKTFYSAVFDWGWGGTDEYAEAQVQGRTIAGVMPRRPDISAEVPDAWLVYFGSTDVDADFHKAVGLGASAVVEPMDIPGTGRFAVLIDPQGATFALFKA